MPPMGTSLHMLAVMSALGVTPKHGEHIRDTMAKACGATGTLNYRMRVKAPKHGAVVLCPGARVVYKQWPHDRWQALAEKLRGEGREVRFAEDGSSLNDLAALLAGASLVIAVDSGPCHLADALGVPVIGLYAATSATTYGPYSNRHRCIDRHREASDALGLEYDSSRHISKGNPMHRISVADVLSAARG